jgi:phage baseplate assembly protein W
MVAISRITGKVISDFDHTIESIINILSTPKLTRLYRRNYGALAFDKIDSIINNDLTLELYSTTAAALKVETRFRLDTTKVNTEFAQEGKLYIDIYGLYLPDGRFIKVEGIRII